MLATSGCKATGAPPAPRVDAAEVAEVVPVEAAPGPDALAEAQATFPELRAYAPAPALELPPWIRQGVLWLAVDDACLPMQRGSPDDRTLYYVRFCSAQRGEYAVSCTQDFTLSDRLVVSARSGCAAALRPRAGGKGGGGGTREWRSHLVDRSGEPYDEGMPQIRRGRRSHTRPLPWSPIEADAERVVFAETWGFTLHDEGRTRVEAPCAPGSIARARERLRRAAPGVGEDVLEDMLVRRHGVSPGGTRRCVARGEERLVRERVPPVLRFEPRIRNLRGVAPVDCAAPCPEDQARGERLRTYLEGRQFVAREDPHVLVLYRTPAACEAGASRSSLRFSDRGCAAWRP